MVRESVYILRYDKDSVSNRKWIVINRTSGAFNSVMHRKDTKRAAKLSAVNTAQKELITYPNINRVKIKIFKKNGDFHRTKTIEKEDVESW